MNTVRLSSPGDLLAALPTFLGREPQDSLVLLGLNPSRQVVAIMRADHAACTDGGAQRLAAMALKALEGRGAVEVLVVLHAHSEDIRARDAIPAVLPWLEDRLEVLDVWIVSGGRYWAAMCADRSCCPPEGRQLPAVPAALAALGEQGAFARVDGVGMEAWQLESPPTGRRNPGAGLPEDPARRRRVMKARSAAMRGRSGDRSAWCAAGLAAWREAIAGAMDGALPSEARTGMLLASLTDVRMRDALILDLYGGTAHECAEILDGGNPDGVLAAVRSIFDGEGMPRDRARVEAALVLAREVAAVMASRRIHKDVAAILTLAGICERWLGADASATEAVMTALDVNPRYSLARLVLAAWSRADLTWHLAG